MSGSPSRRVLRCLAYNLLNLLLVVIFFKEATIVRSDGPGGFGEVALKGLLSWCVLGLFAGGGYASVVACKGDAPVSKPARLWPASMVLLLFALLAVFDACSDGAGHCRNWQVVF
jgi:uncharacterized membrane protein